MTGFDIAVLAGGVILIIISFFLVDKKNKDLIELTPEEKREKIEELLSEFKPQAQQTMEEISSACIEDTKEELERLTNEKILAINEFGEQLLTKIESSHEEVVFLYDMMMKKEEEMKSTLNRMEVLRKENQSFIDKIMELRNAKMKVMGTKTEPIKENIKIAPEPSLKPITVPPVTEKIEVIDTNLQDENDEEELPENIKRQILELHERNFSIREISRRLSVGQGEVKLFIDLYG